MARLCRGLPVGSYCSVACNSGIKTCQIIGVLNLKGCKKRKLSATVGSFVKVTATVAPKLLRKKTYRAIVVRQKKFFFRGHYRIYFLENSVVILDDKENILKGTRIRGVIAKEAELKVPALIGKGALTY